MIPTEAGCDDCGWTEEFPRRILAKSAANHHVHDDVWIEDVPDDG